MSTAELKVALAQMEVIAGQPETNLATIESFVVRAKDAGANLVVFPELCLGGRYLGNRWQNAEFVNYVASFDERVCALSDGIGIIFGNNVPIPASGIDLPSPEADAYLSDVRFCVDGEWIDPEHDCDCDDDCDCDGDCHCEDGCDCGCGGSPVYHLALEGIDAHVAICIGDLSGSGALVSPTMFDIASDFAGDCDLIVDLAASPWVAHPLSQTLDEEQLDGLGDAALPPIVRVNCIGMQNTDKAVLAFDGHSAIYLNGRAGASCRDDFQEDLLIASFDFDEGTVAFMDEGRPRYDNVDEKVLDGIVSALRRFDAQVFPFHPNWVIGLSGGLDSSVTAALMALAFDSTDRIVGYNLATRYNSDATKMNAYELAQALGIRLVNGSIEGIVKATNEVVSLYGYPEGATEGLVLENIQARLRGHMLSTFAAIEGGVIMNNGNKVEATLGYATLYGDAVGAISPIGDITKVRLFNLAHLINARFGKTVIPLNLLPEETPDGYIWETMPSAELKDAQKDPMKWFYHDWLIESMVDNPQFSVEAFMQAYLEDKLASSPVAKWIRFYGLDDPIAFIEDLEWVIRQTANSVFKRIQMPPTIMVVRDTCGFEYRENQVKFEQTARYRELRAAILAL